MGRILPGKLDRVRSNRLGSGTLRDALRRLSVGMIVVGMALPSSAVQAQTRPAPRPTANTPPPTAPTANRAADLPGSGSLTGRRIEDVRVVGNTEVPTAIILNLVRSRVG